MRHKLSPRAVRDVAQLYRKSILQFGAAHADRYLDRLDALFVSLGENPYAVAARPDLPGIRLKRFEAHHVYFTVAGDEVIIVRVLHGRQLAEGRLKP